MKSTRSLRLCQSLTLITSLIFTTPANGQVNIALGKPASQTSNLEWNGFAWTANKAVDGCALRDDSENQQCCSSSLEMLGENYWTVDLVNSFLVEAIIVLGRSDTPTQLANFELFRQEVTSGPEVKVFDDVGVSYGDGNFTIVLDPPVLMRTVVIRRPTILTLCEVQVFQVIPDSTTATTSTSTGTSSTSTSTSSTSTSTPSTTAFSTTQPTTSSEASIEDSPTEENVALNKTATQFSDLNYLFFWTADKAVDGCALRDDPDNQACCSATEGGMGNFWTVDLEQQYLVNRIEITARPAGFINQFENFAVYTKQTEFSTEQLVYDNSGQPYNDGLFNIVIALPTLVQYVTIRRPSGTIMVICEVEVFASVPETTTATTAILTTTTATTQPPTTESITITTTEASCPPFTYGELCNPCGFCLNNESCDPAMGSCPSGCAAGYFGTTCELECPGGLYGPGCFGICANCAGGENCDHVTGQCPSGCDPGWSGELCDQAFSTTQPTTSSEASIEDSPTEENVALNKTATQFSDLDYLFFWTADKAVDGCALRDDPDNQACCSATEGGMDNFWTVDLEQQYLVNRIEITARPAGFINQFENFAVYTKQTEFSTEQLMYDNSGQPYNDGLFNIVIALPTLVQYVTIRRPSGTIMVICEVEVFASISETTTATTAILTTTTATTQPPTTVSTTITTTEASCPPFTYGELCNPCGFCLNNESCDPAMGSCPSGCAAGYFGTTCELECPGGLYGPGCFGICANCAGGENCDHVTGQCPSGCDPGWSGELCDQASSTTSPTISSGTTEADTPAEENVALNKTATQFSDLDYLFFWTADKAVDGCSLRDDPDNQACCSATEGGMDNFWTVDLEEQYLVNRIDITARPADFSNQFEGFAVYTKESEFSAEQLLYDNSGQSYNDGLFTLFIPLPTLVRYVKLRRPSGTIMVICEVEVFASFADFTTTTERITTTAAPSQPPTTETTTITSTVSPTQDTASMSSTTLQTTSQTQSTTQEPTQSTTQESTQTTTQEPTQSTTQESTQTTTQEPTQTTTQEPIQSTTLGPTQTTTEEPIQSSTVGQTQSTTEGVSDTEENVALNKPATQFSDLDYLFFWTADKAVDGCSLRDDPDNQACCSATQGGVDNFWTVDLEEQYLVNRIVITARPADFSNQFEGFAVYTKQTEFSAEQLLYDNSGQPYNDGLFAIGLPLPTLVRFVTIRRPTGTIMVICEVEVFAYSTTPPPPLTTTEIITTTAATTLSPTTETTTIASTVSPTQDTTSTAATSSQTSSTSQSTSLGPTQTTTQEQTQTTTKVPTQSTTQKPTQSTTQEPTQTTTKVPTQSTTQEPSQITTSTQSPTQTTTDDDSSAEQNVALNKTATQFSDLDYLFFWTADKAVDGCSLRDDPDNQACCSATEGGADNFWTVDLEQQYLVNRIAITARPADFSNQFENFAVYMKQTEFSTEQLLYDNSGQPYNNGLFTLSLPLPTLVQYVTIRRPSGTIMVICEVEVFATVPDSSTPITTATTQTPTATTTTQTPTVSTTTRTPSATTIAQTPSATTTTQTPTASTTTRTPSATTITQTPSATTTTHTPSSTATTQTPTITPTTQTPTITPTTQMASTTTTTQTPSTDSTSIGTTTESCARNTYGDECTPCGKCITTVPCNRETGVCALGCLPGWQMPLCSTPCQPGFYGVSCSETCGECLGDSPCDLTNGACPGGCEPGWEGINCDTVSITSTTTKQTTTTQPQANMNVALNKTATQFSDLDYIFFWTADKAVDGCSLRDDPDNQACCSATQGGVENFWTVDLEQQYLVNRINVTGRPSENSIQLEGFQLYTRQSDIDPETLVYDNSQEAYNDGLFTIQLDPPQIVQLVTARRPLGAIMVLCEVEVFGVQYEGPTTSTTPIVDGTDIPMSTSSVASTMSSQGPTQSSTLGPTPTTTTHGPTQSSTLGPTQATTTQGPTQSSTPVPTQTTTTQGPTQSSTPLPTQATTTQGPTQNSTPVPTQTTTIQGPTQATTTQGPTQNSTPVPTQTTTTQGPTQSSTPLPTQATTTQGPTQNSTPVPTQTTTTQGPTQSSTPVPTQTTTTQGPTQNSTPVPTQTTTTQGPTQNSTPVPTQTTTTQGPTQATTTQGPTQSSTPLPTQTTTTQGPTQSSTPVQTQTTTTQGPTQSSTPVPTQTTTTQGPTQNSTPVPTQTTTTQDPTQSSTPVPTQTTTAQEPTQSSTPRPTQTTTTQGPTQSSTPVPTQTTTTQGPTQSSTPVPTQTTTTQDPTQSSTPIPTQTTTTQGPTQSSTPVPTQTTTTQGPTQSSTTQTTLDTTTPEDASPRAASTTVLVVTCVFLVFLTWIV